MKQVPKYVLKWLERRRKLAWELNAVGIKIDRYCEKISVDLGDEKATFGCHPLDAPAGAARGRC